MRLLDKYVLKEFLAPFLFGVCRLYGDLSRGRYASQNRWLCFPIWGICDIGSEGVHPRTATHHRLYLPDGRTLGLTHVLFPSVRGERAHRHAYLGAELLPPRAAGLSGSVSDLPLCRGLQ